MKGGLARGPAGVFVPAGSSCARRPARLFSTFMNEDEKKAPRGRQTTLPPPAPPAPKARPPVALSRGLLVCLVMVLAGAACAAERPADLKKKHRGEKSIPVAGPEGKKLFGFVKDDKLYRLVNGVRLTGKDINDLRFRENRAKFAPEFAREKLAEAELERAGIVVTRQEEETALCRLLRQYALKLGLSPREADPQRVAVKLGRPLFALRQAARLNIGILKLLARRGKLKQKVLPESPKGRAAVAEFIGRLEKSREVITDPEVLLPGEGVRVDGRPYDVDLLRKYVVERLGAPTNREFKELLEVLTLGCLVRAELKRRGGATDVVLLGVTKPDKRGAVVKALEKILKMDEDTALELAYQPKATVLSGAPRVRAEKVRKALVAVGGKVELRARPLSDDDRSFYWSFQCRLLELERNLAEGEGRKAFVAQLRSKGKTVAQFLNNPTTKADIGLTRLARLELGEEDLKKEFAAHPERYQRREKLFAHLFIRVTDPRGRPYQPLWRAPGHKKLNEYAARVREERFQAKRPDIEQYLGPAKADFRATARRFSDDAATRKTGGLVGRVGKQTILPPPCDENVKRAALKLKPGEMSGPVRSAYGWHLIKCLEKQDVTYEEARERIYLRLLKVRREKILRDLRAGAKIEDRF